MLPAQASQIRQESSPAALVNVSRDSDGFHSSWGSTASVQRAQNPGQLTAYQQTMFSNPFAQPGTPVHDLMHICLYNPPSKYTTHPRQALRQR